jgi:programmed cell death protein 5
MTGVCDGRPADGGAVSRISLTRPQLAASVEDLLVRMGQQGQIRGQVSDEALKGLLEQVSVDGELIF